ncbi:MAG: adenylate/guanylate cyclase domain-containing protein, partial [Betaproteobacteria bacterium]|nr:adenylate/guanylate cyclase domain-containing protein [Betaproteobacteria bacterium]
MEKLSALWTKYFSSINAIIRASLGLAIVALFVIYYIISYSFEDKAKDRITFLQRLEEQAYDIRLRATMPEKMDPRIVIIDVDEKTLAAEGRWPLSRDRWVLLLKQLFDNYKIKVVGFDVLFTEPDTSSGLDKLESLGQTVFKSSPEFQEKLNELRPALDYDTQFAQTIKKYPVVLAIAGSNERKGLESLQLGALPAPTFDVASIKKPVLASEIDGYSGNLKELQSAASAAGHILPQVDFDGVLRRIPLFIRFKDGYYESLALATYRTYLDNEPVKIVLREDEGDRIPKLKNAQVRDTIIPVDGTGASYIPYRGKSPMFRYISATDVMRGKLSPGELEGKIAFVGSSAQGLFDLRNTPVGEVYPGVETHANMVSGFLDNNLKQKPRFEFAISGYIILFLGIPLALALVKLNPLWATVTAAGTAVLYAAFNMYWWYGNVVLPLAMPLLMIGILYILNMTYGFFIEARSKRQITGIFGTYVPKELVEEMAKDPGTYTTKGESRDMTVLFSDVRNFTSISEGLSATELTAMMNAYLTAMTETIQQDRGTIDKYIGDAIMAFWGAPVKDEKHAEAALHSALAMQKKIKDIAPDFVSRGWPKLEIGVGLNCGVMNVGDMGSTFRRAYTVMGDAVNLASRLEGLTKEYGVGILVSENIVNTVPSVIYRELDRV